MIRRFLPFALCLPLVACTNQDFDPVSKINGVRIIATQASNPYAKPGDKIEFKMLAYDGRKEPTTPMRVFWIPTVCENPLYDLYYACYLNFAAQFTPGVPIEDKLTWINAPKLDGSPLTPDNGKTLNVTVSSDIITRHTPVAGSAPFGSLFAFSIACAGDHVEYLGLRTHPSPQSPPFGCFDAAGNQLGDKDFVFAFSRVYVFDQITNNNPEITSLFFNGEDVMANNQASDGLAVCTKSKEDDCPSVSVNVSLAEGSQEADPGSNFGKEQIWVDYYGTGGKFDDDVRILYDPAAGRVTDTAVDYRIPRETGDTTIWAVVHDNRGGVAWQSHTFNVQ